MNSVEGHSASSTTNKRLEEERVELAVVLVLPLSSQHPCRKISRPPHPNHRVVVLWYEE